MHLNDGDIVYLYINSSNTIECCRVVAADFGGNGQHLVHGTNTQCSYVAETDDLYKTAELCATETARKRAEEYKKCYQTFDSIEALMLHLLWNAIETNLYSDIEITAMIHRASEFIGADMMTAVEKYAESMEKEKRENTVVEL